MLAGTGIVPDRGRSSHAWLTPNWNIAFDEHDTTHKQDVCPIDTKNANVIFYIRNANLVGKDGKVKQALYTGKSQLPGGQTMLTDNNGAFGPPDTVKSITVTIAPDPVARS